MAEVISILVLMDTATLSAFKALSFKDPKPFLIKLRKLEYELTNKKIPAKLKSLRTNSLKEWRELREAALFCYFMGERIGTTVYLAKDESQDYDFVAAWVNGDTSNYAPVQLKEIVPKDANQSASLESVIATLPQKYVDSGNLVVAIHLNQQCHFNPNDLRLPALNIAELWVFGATSPDQHKWGLWGNFLQLPTGTLHEYPTTV